MEEQRGGRRMDKDGRVVGGPGHGAVDEVGCVGAGTVLPVRCGRPPGCSQPLHIPPCVSQV